MRRLTSTGVFTVMIKRKLLKQFFYFLWFFVLVSSVAVGGARFINNQIATSTESVQTGNFVWQMARSTANTVYFYGATAGLQARLASTGGMRLGQWYDFINASDNSVSIQYANGSAAKTISSGGSSRFQLIASPTTNGTWSIQDYGSGGASVTTNGSVATWAPATNCDVETTATTVTELPADSDCSSPVISNFGDVSCSDVGDDQLEIQCNLSAGVYSFDVVGPFLQRTDANICQFFLIDSDSAIVAAGPNMHNGMFSSTYQIAGITLTGMFEYTASKTNHKFTLAADTQGAACKVRMSQTLNSNANLTIRIIRIGD